MSIRRLCCLVLTLWLLAGSAFAAAPALQEEIYAPEALLYCVESGQTLYEKEADKPVPPASVTKLMTALVVLEHEADLSQTTTVSDTAVDIERDSTNIALVPGEEVTLEDMLYATLMQSANDAANVLAEYVGGTRAGFAQMMNDRAAALGCTGSHFENAHGLDAPGHVMTARDVARILAALLDDPRFLEIAGALVYTMPATNMQPEARTFYTKQRMLRQNSKFYNEYAIAGKNGYTTGAQHTQCMAARRDGLTFIAVSMGSSGNMYYPWRDMRTLFAYALDDLHPVTIGAGQLRQMADAAGIAGADPGAVPGGRSGRGGRLSGQPGCGGRHRGRCCAVRRRARPGRPRDGGRGHRIRAARHRPGCVPGPIRGVRAGVRLAQVAAHPTGAAGPVCPVVCVDLRVPRPKGAAQPRAHCAPAPRIPGTRPTRAPGMTLQYA